ncbi:DUF6197 family protein [Brevundimonas sp. FT23028]|uniref:DUF6197 family protein n=1 Tax=Brevundimonas sp. FT23028 TaxID=3393748 RepID=UPI003B588A1E
MATVSEILTKAADLLETPGAWTQGAEYRNEAGEDISDFDDDADDLPADLTPVCWCAAGAIWCQPISTPEKVAACEALAAAIGSGDRYEVPKWNDAPERTQAEVVAALRTAASQAEAATGAQPIHPWMTDAERAASEAA